MKSISSPGKGKGQRVKSHLKNALADLSSDSIKNTTLRELSEKYDLLELVISRHVSDDQAFAVESVLIRWVYGLESLLNSINGHDKNHVWEKNNLLTENPYLDVERKLNIKNGIYSHEQLAGLNESGALNRLDEISVTLVESGFKHLENYLEEHRGFDPGRTNGHIAEAFQVKDLEFMVDMTKTCRPRLWILNKSLISIETKKALEKENITIGEARNINNRYSPLLNQNEEVGQFNQMEEFYAFIDLISKCLN